MYVGKKKIFKNVILFALVVAVLIIKYKTVPGGYHTYIYKFNLILHRNNATKKILWILMPLHIKKKCYYGHVYYLYAWWEKKEWQTGMYEF